MDTKEHTELGNALRVTNIGNNPYLRIDDAGVLHIRLQRFGRNNRPETMDLELSAGEVIAMAGDYFTQANWTMNLHLPDRERFGSAIELGRYLTNKQVEPQEISAFVTAYNNLAAPDVSRTEIERIYSINKANYIPFSATLNFYAQQMMLYLRVKNYGEMLIRNQTHFTPWSVRVYMLGHSIALHCARVSYELKQLAENPSYYSDNSDVAEIKKNLMNKTLNGKLVHPRDLLIDLAHQYHAQAYGMELFTFHYYTDHFAAGHTSMVGDLRAILPSRFGTLGAILANSIHDQLNKVSIYTTRPYDSGLNPKETAGRAWGDGAFNLANNDSNRNDCIRGMSASLEDINGVLAGANIPLQTQFSGLNYLPDVDYNSRQPEPLLLFHNCKVYYRKNLSQTKILAPSEYETLRANPEKNGYHELTSKWQAFKLVVKLRLFPYVYDDAVVPISQSRLTDLLADEKRRDPQRSPIKDTLVGLDSEPTIQDWRTKKDRMDTIDGLYRYGLLKQSQRVVMDKESEPSLQNGLKT